MTDFSAVRAHIDDSARRLHGCTVRITRDHETLLSYAAGYSDEAHTIPASDRDLYYMYSCTKPVTAAAAMQLVEKGVLELDAPAARYLPEIADAFVLRDGQKVKVGDALTVRHLFTMTAGFTYSCDTPYIRRVQQETNGHGTTRQLVGAILEEPLSFWPGDKYQYSLCLDVLAAVVEAASGMTFGAYVKEHIFTPLGMTHSAFQLSELKNAGTMAAMYRYNAEADAFLPLPAENGYILSDHYESGGAGLISCTADYALFADAMACGGCGANGQRILRPETIALMHEDQLPRVAKDTSFWCSVGPGYSYGLGVRTMIDRSCGARSPLGEFGWDGASATYLMVDPVNHLSIAFGTHNLEWNAAMGFFHSVLRDKVYEALTL